MCVMRDDMRMETWAMRSRCSAAWVSPSTCGLPGRVDAWASKKTRNKKYHDECFGDAAVNVPRTEWDVEWDVVA